MIKVYKINNKTELDMFNKIYGSNISPTRDFPYYCRYGSRYGSDGLTEWASKSATYEDVGFQMCSFFDLYLNQL